MIALSRLLATKIASWLPLIVGIGLLFAGYAIRHTGYTAGKLAENQNWQKVVAKASEEAITLTRERQSKVDDAALWKAERDKSFNEKIRPINLEVQKYAKMPAGNGHCISDDGVRIGKEAIDAANSAIASHSR